MNTSASVAARVAGAIGALGYLTGLVDGPVIGVLAGLSLVTFGRALASPRGSELLGPASFAVLAGAAGAVALRWGTLDLPEIRGAQGVLGPTLVVEPLSVAVLSAFALLAATIALGLWLIEPARGEGLAEQWWWVEGAAGALLLTSLFCGPPPTDVVQVGLSLGTALAVGGGAYISARMMASRSVAFRYIVVGACTVVVGAAATVSGSLA